MRLSQVVRSGPNQYICTEDAIKYLAEKLSVFNKPVVVTGVKSFEAFNKFAQVPRNWPVLRYDQTASEKNMRELAAKAADADVIVGIGGGKALDTAKGMAELLNIEVVLVPTLAGTCAGYTPLSAVYDEHKQFSHVAYYKRSAYLSLVDLRIIADAPTDYLLGGIGDSLAKWYESAGITRNMKEWPALVTLGLSAAKNIRDVLLNDSEQALKDKEAGKITPAFQRVVDSVIAVSGTVGGFAGEFGRIAGAHAVHNGLSFLEETHGILHGMKVAYGILVQLAALGEWDEIKSLMPFYKKLGFPYNLKTLGVKDSGDATIRQIAEYAAGPKETFVLLGDYKADDVAKAMRGLERLTNVAAAK